MTHTSIDVRPVGLDPDGLEIRQWTLCRASEGISVTVLEWGATIQSVRTPDREGRIDEIALGFPRLGDYLMPAYRATNPYFGATVGRYANRIAGGAFELDGARHELSRNEGSSTLHGGSRGFDQHRWDGVEIADGVRMSRVSPHGEEGFPGRVEVSVEFRLGAGALSVEYLATTDRPTVVSLTNHSYWNLGGESAGAARAMDHELSVLADSYVPIDDAMIPLGTLEPVRDSPFDFRTARRIGSRLADTHLQLARAGGIDHTYVLRPGGRQLRQAMLLADPGTGRTLAVATTEPGLQVYTGNMLDGTFHGHGGTPYGRRAGLAFEPQHFPDSPNRPGFPSTMLRPGRVMRSTTRFSFGSR